MGMNFSFVLSEDYTWNLIYILLSMKSWNLEGRVAEEGSCWGCSKIIFQGRRSLAAPPFIIIPILIPCDDWRHVPYGVMKGFKDSMTRTQGVLM